MYDEMMVIIFLL